MSKKIFKGKKRWRSVISVILVVAIALGACGAIVSFAKSETKTIGAGAFTRGALDDEGNYIESNQSLYTKDAFLCQGLRVVPDFESLVTYDIYLYDYSDNLLAVEKENKGIWDKDYPLAKTARIVVYPEIPEDVKVSDFKIRIWEIFKYANDLSITVDRDQNMYETTNLFNDDSIVIYDNSSTGHVVGKPLTFTDSGVNGVRVLALDIDDSMGFYDIFVKASDGEVLGVFASICDGSTENKEFGTVLCNSYPEILELGSYEDGSWVKCTLDVPARFQGGCLIVKLPMRAECCIYGYN